MIPRICVSIDFENLTILVKVGVRVLHQPPWRTWARHVVDSRRNLLLLYRLRRLLDLLLVNTVL